MAARSRVDSGVNERRLRPVYDCLDNGNNKKALQEADKVLRKQKDFQCAKVLKALALLRLGRNEDSTRLLGEVRDEVPTDDATLQAMTICYRELQKLDWIAEVYEAAMRKDPTNEELLTHLFMAYVRIGEYKKQQQVAMSLYKLKSKNPYYFWAIMSIVMQAHEASEEMACKMFLPLAERMAEKYARENRIEAEAEVHLYLLILELEQKYEKALEVLRSPLGDKLTSFLDFKRVKCAEYLSKLHKWSEVIDAYKELITSNPDNWSFYCEFLSATFQVTDESGLTIDSAKVNDAVESARNFIVSVVEMQNGSEGRSLRGPFLARIKLCCLCQENKYELRDSLVDLLNDYFVRFGDKPCCFNDVNLFLDRLDDEEKLCFLTSARKTVGLNLDGDEIDYPIDAKQMQRHLCYVHLCHRLDVHCKLEVAKRHRLVSELLQRYRHASKFGADLLSTDIQPNDGYCLLASHILFDIWKETGDDRSFNQLLVTLEAALVNSPSSHQIKLLLLKLYSSIGAAGPCYGLYDSMDIKHILQDALGYLVAPVLVAKGHFSQGSILYGNMLKFFNSNYKDTVDYLIASYKFGSFTKIREFVNFRERLRNSLQLATASVERTILDLILEADNHEFTETVIAGLQIDPEVDTIKTEDLRDNRDMHIMLNWSSPEKQVLTTTKQKSLEAEVVWWQMRNVLVRALVAACTVSRRQNCDAKTESDVCLVSNGIKRLPVDSLCDLVKRLESVVEAQKVESYHLPEVIVQGPSQSRLVLNLEGRYIVPIIGVLNDVIALSKLDDHGDCAEMEVVFRKSTRDEIKECIVRVTNKLKSADGLQNLASMGHILEELVNVSEMVGFLVIVLGFCRRILESFKGVVGKKGKKRREATTQSTTSKVVDNYNALLGEIEILTNELYVILNIVQLENVLSHLRVTDYDTVFRQQECDVLMLAVSIKVEKSYRQSLVGIGDLLKSKLKYMSLLRLC